MTDAYYELIDSAIPRGEKFAASDHVISTWGSTMQNAAPVSALLVRALERCSPSDDARISRVVVDLLGPVPVTDQLWVSARIERPGTRIELVAAEMLAPGRRSATGREGHRLAVPAHRYRRTALHVRRDDDADAAVVRGGRHRQRHGDPARPRRVDVSQHRSRGAHSPAPEGQWVGVRSENHYGRDGVGISRGTLFDELGPVAAIQQAQPVRRRPPPDGSG